MLLAWATFSSHEMEFCVVIMAPGSWLVKKGGNRAPLWLKCHIHMKTKFWLGQINSEWLLEIWGGGGHDAANPPNLQS